MNNIFNTSFEVSLRILIILNTVQTRLSIDRITDLDFIAIYGKDFGVSEYNLHGDNDYRFSEYTSKREIVSQAIKELVLRGYITPHCNKSGFNYSISKEGVATVYKGNIIKNLIMDCQSYTKYRPNETTGGIFVSWRRKEELPTGA